MNRVVGFDLQDDKGMNEAVSMRFRVTISFHHDIYLVYLLYSTSSTGRTPLHLCASRGHVDCCETLILQGATIIVHDSIDRSTSLHCAGEYASILCYGYGYGYDHERVISMSWFH